MAENYKHLYEQMKKMVAMYQDEIVPGMRKTIEELEQNRVEVVRCKDCWCWGRFRNSVVLANKGKCSVHESETEADDFCSYGERRDGE